MNNFSGSVEQFWEVLTGVTNDKTSKVIRFLCFAVLIIGILWAVWNYIQANRISDTNAELDFGDSLNYSSTRTRKNEALDKIVAVAQTVKQMRDGGEAIASALTDMNRRPFNIEGYDDMGLEALSGTFNGGGAALNEGISVPEQNIEPETVYVRAIMLSEKSSYAVVDAAGARGMIVRRGSKLPGELGRVVRIKSDGITIRKDKQETVYTIQ